MVYPCDIYVYKYDQPFAPETAVPIVCAGITLVLLLQRPAACCVMARVTHVSEKKSVSHDDVEVGVCASARPATNIFDDDGGGDGRHGRTRRGSS